MEPSKSERRPDSLRDHVFPFLVDPRYRAGAHLPLTDTRAPGLYVTPCGHGQFHECMKARR